MHACANLLLEKEKITREEFEALFDEGVAVGKEIAIDNPGQVVQPEA